MILDLELTIKNKFLVVDKVYYKDTNGLSKDTIETYDDIVTKITGITYDGSVLLGIFSGIVGETLTVETEWGMFSQELLKVSPKATLKSIVGEEEIELTLIQAVSLYEIDSGGELWVY